MQQPIILFIQKRLRLLRNKQDAQEMARYMKTIMPFYGIKAGERKRITKQAIKRYPDQTQKEYIATIKALWKLPHREEKYIAIDIACAYPIYIDIKTLPLFEKMIRQGSWWDFVDEIARHLIGTVLTKQPSVMWPIIERWNDDPNLWIRRSSIICQNKFKLKTDETRLFSLCLQRAHEKEFFIQKAIGWALREYAKTKPQKVHAFITKHKNQLSNLSYREAAKHLDT